MQRLAAILFLVLFVASDAICGKARAIGIYEDAAEAAGFLSSVPQGAVQGRLVITDAQGTEASIFLMSATFLVNEWFLLQLELPHVTTSLDGRELESTLGDLRFRGRFDVATRMSRTFRLTWEVGTGSGTGRVFPYSSQAVEFAGAVALTDTLEVFEYWASAGGATFQRVPAGLAEQEEIVNFWRFTGGVAVPFGTLGLRLGTSVLVFRGGGSRDHYFARLTWDHDRLIRLFATAQIEGGASDQRVTDTSADVGMTVYF